ncbi:MAG: PaaI family thioesterase [Mesorhizobium sp.]|nr:PaaI family thioesterase [Mesorhizobium sp.]MCO5161308.1 PaaI family thioesterase [Mesorhizobium sp.]
MISGSMADVAATMQADLPHDEPPGFVPIDTRAGFHTMMGQIYGKMENGLMVCGFRCSPRHMNSHGTCHGGMLASFADFSAYSLRLAADLPVTSIPTATLSMEYLRPVKLGDWVESRVELTRRGRRLLFCRITGSVNGVSVFTASGVFVPGPDDPGGLDALSRVIGKG